MMAHLEHASDGVDKHGTKQCKWIVPSINAYMMESMQRRTSIKTNNKPILSRENSTKAKVN